MNKLRTWMGMLIIVFAMVAMLVPRADAAYSVKQAFVRITVNAGETLSTGDVVMIKDSDGEAYQADANDGSLRPAVGIVGSLTGGDGEPVEIIVSGILTGWSGLSEGTNGYLSETAGEIDQSAPSWEQKVGFAISTTDYLFNCQNYFDSSAVTSLGVLSGASPVILEGASADDHETTIAVTDPTADRTLTLPDASGTVLAGSTDAITATSEGVAASLLTLTTLITTNGDSDADNVTLADGTAGQVKIFVVVAEGDPADTVKITPANYLGGTQITFSATPVGEGCIMVFDGTDWGVVGNNGGTES
jgi:hypothetical protein